MPVVATGILSSPVPGLWRRLSLISEDGSITGLTDAKLVGQLEELGIPRHQLGVVHLLHSWQHARVPPDVAFALWYLRERVDEQGLIYRRAALPVEESSPAIRYVQLAVDAGETRESDPTMRQAVQWLLDHQLPDGSIPLIIATGHGETGQTSRTLKALQRLHDPALAGPLDAMRDYLLRTPIEQPTGAAWSYSTIDRTVVTGSTSLAVTALIQCGRRDDVVHQGIRYLLAAQDAGGGWAEVPGHQPTIHNTFNVVRAIGSAAKSGILTADEAASALDRARHWFVRTVRRQPPRTILDHSFAVRTAIHLNLIHERRFENLSKQLARRRRQFLDPAADSYAETAIAAIALLESSRHIDATHAGHQHWHWRWQLPTTPPPFLARGAYFYEMLYGAIKARWWVRTVDVLMNTAIVDRSAGLVLGTITALGIVNPGLSEILIKADTGRSTLTMIGVGILLLVWNGIKIAAQTSVLRSLTSSAAAFVPAAALTWILHSPTPTVPALISLLGLRVLVIDVVAFTADSTGLLDRLLPKK
ncbi:MAG: prenyltransferase/squalene oxidase repeat-containing protein [Kibdelosporangium sp.]